MMEGKSAEANEEIVSFDSDVFIYVAVIKPYL